MEIGLHLPNAGPGITAEGILQVATAAEDLGFDAVWMFDHLFTPTDLRSKYPYTPSGDYALTAQDPFFDPLALFGVLASATRRVKLGTSVMIGAYRHPIVLGKVVATAENFAPGRIVLGLGAGWMREEFEALGIPMRRRGARHLEYIRALRTLWSGEPSSFDGEFYSWPEAGFLPTPTAPVPIIVGGHSDAALHRAAAIGDGWAAVTAPGQGSGLDGLAARIELLEKLLEQEGRSLGGFELLYQHVLLFGDEANPKLPFSGPPDAVAAAIARLDEMGVKMIDLMVLGPPGVIVETAQRFAEEVRPLLD